MQAVRAVVVLAAVALAAARYIQERHTLHVVGRLPGPEARAYYERRRRSGERAFVVLTIGVVAAAVVTVLRTFGGVSW